MSSKGNLILAIIWIILSPAWFWAENTAMGIIWLCAGVTKLIIALIRRNKEKKSNNYYVKKKAYDFLFGNSGFGKKDEVKGGVSYYVQNRQNKNRTLSDILKGNK